MRGHIGVRVPRQPVLTVVITQITADMLTYDAPQPEPRITQITTDVLTYDAPQPEPRITQIMLDVLTWEPSLPGAPIISIATGDEDETDIFFVSPSTAGSSPIPSPPSLAGYKFYFNSVEAAPNAITETFNESAQWVALFGGDLRGQTVTMAAVTAVGVGPLSNSMVVLND